jgi:hypothetical protein
VEEIIRAAEIKDATKINVDDFIRMMINDWSV